MVSTYQYATLANLELYAVKDYSGIDSALTDAVVEDKISNAEKYINSYVGTIFTGTIPPDIELLTKMIAKIFLDNYMIEEKIGSYAQQDGVIIDILGRYDIVLLLEKYKNLYSTNKGIFISRRKQISPADSYRAQLPWKWQW